MDNELQSELASIVERAKMASPGPIKTVDRNNIIWIFRDEMQYSHITDMVCAFPKLVIEIKKLEGVCAEYNRQFAQATEQYLESERKKDLLLLGQELDMMREDAATFKAALRKYGRHSMSTCFVHSSGSCDCGLLNILNA